jgi:hypothetical protein
MKVSQTSSRLLGHGEPMARANARLACKRLINKLSEALQTQSFLLQRKAVRCESAATFAIFRSTGHRVSRQRKGVRIPDGIGAKQARGNLHHPHALRAG